MKIGIEVTGCLTEKPTGIANYIVNLYKELEKFDKECDLEAFIWLSSYKYRERLLNYLSPRRVSWHYKPYNLHKINNQLDIAHSTDAKFLNLPNTKKVVTIHDLAIFKKELREIPDYTTEKFLAKVLKTLEKVADRSDLIIADSLQTKIDFLEMFPRYDPDRIEPIYLAGTLDEAAPIADDDEIFQKFGVKKSEYFLFIGAISARKNLVNMIEAFKESGMSSKAKFLLVGFMSMGLDRIIGAIEKHGLQDSVVLADYVEERFIPALYKNSLGLAFATFYEGFGIPIVEAMKFKTPVMHGDIGSAPEVAQDHGISVNPFSIGEIADGFRELGNVANEEIEKAYIHSKDFTWKKTAEKTLNVYRKLVE